MTVPGVVFLVKSFTDRVFSPKFVMIHVLVCGLFFTNISFFSTTARHSLH